MNLSSRCKKSCSQLLSSLLLLGALFPGVPPGSGQAYAESAAASPAASLENASLIDPSSVQPEASTASLATYSDQDFSLRVLHTNDTHAHLENIARRVTAIHTERTSRTLLLDAGDVFSGTLYFTQFNGLADLQFMNDIGYDAMTFGNHEFDKGLSTLKAFMNGASFPFVSANIDFTSRNSELAGLYHNETGLLDDSQNPALNGNIYPTVIKEVYGEKIGILGLTTEDTVGLSSPGNTITFENYRTSAEQAVDMLKAQGVNKIIALSHLGYNIDQQLAVEVPDIDIIVGGHTHTKLTVPVEVPHGSSGDTTLIVQTGEYGQNLGELDATFNTAGQITSYAGRLLDVSKYAEDPAAKNKLAGYDQKLAPIRQTVVGYTYSDLSIYRTIDGQSVRVVRQEETAIGNLIADSIVAKVKEMMPQFVSSDDLARIKGVVAIQNGGGIRQSIDTGPVTLSEVLSTLPFNNSLVALKVTGGEIIASLENAVSGLESDQGRFAQVSGIRYAFDSSKKPEIIDPATGTVTQTGERIVSVEIRQADGSYAPIDPDAYYLLSTNSFMAGGGDFYRALAGAKADGRYYELGLPDFEVFTDYLKKNDPVTIGLEGRVTDVNDAAASPSPAPSASSGTSGSTGSATAIPTPTPTPAPSASASPAASAAPVQVTNITASDLGQRIAALPAGASEVVIPVTASAGGAEVVLPGSALIQQAAAQPALVLTFDSGSVSYSLPLSVLNGPALTRQLGTGDFTVTVGIRPADAAAQTGVNQAAAGKGVTLAAPVVEFSVTAKAGSRSVSLDSFGDTYVERSIDAAGTLSGNAATGAVYDPDTGTLSFVPSLFAPQPDGTTKVTLKRNSNSYYTVVQASKSFSDLNGHWAKPSVDLLASKLIAAGTDGSTFSPSRAVTRAEFAVLLTRALGLKTVTGQNPFTDVNPAKWYAGAIKTASAAGLISGYENGKFKPDSPITRQEMASILFRAADYTGTKLPAHTAALAKFTDASQIGAWSKSSVSAMAAAGLVQGAPDGSFAPRQSATRAEAAVMLEKTLRLLKFID